MKQLYWYVILTGAVLQAAASGVFAQATITGLLPMDYQLPYLAYSQQQEYELRAPFDTLWLQDGLFRLQLEAEGAQLITIAYFSEVDGKWPAWLPLYLFPGDSLHINTGHRNENGQIQPAISGSNGPGHEQWAAFKAEPPIYYLEGFYKIPEQGGDIAPAIIRKIESYTSPFDSLLQQGQVSRDYHAVVTSSIREMFCSHLISHLYRQRGQFGAGMAPESKNRLAEAFLEYSSLSEKTPFRALGYAFSCVGRLRYELLRESGLQDYSQIADTLVALNGETYRLSAMYTPILREPDAAAREYLLAYYLHFEYTSLIIEHIVATAGEVFRYFKALYPDSRYTPAIEKARLEHAGQLAGLRDSEPPPEPALSPTRYYEAWQPQIIDDAGLMEDFDFKNETTDLSRGKYYVDIWATWCGPCVQEMQYNYRTDSLLHARGFQRLYISLDGPENYGKWHSTLYGLHLGGLHVLAGEKLRDWLFQNFGTGSSIKLPRYLLLEEGRVVEPWAASPGKLELLGRQVE